MREVPTVTHLGGPRSPRGKLILAVAVILLLFLFRSFAILEFGIVLILGIIIVALWASVRSRSWYARPERGLLGPLSEAELVHLYQGGQVTAATPVRNGLDKAWYSGTAVVNSPDRLNGGLKMCALFAIVGFFLSYFVFGTVLGVPIPFDKLGDVLFPSVEPSQAMVRLFAEKAIPGLEEIRKGIEEARMRILVSTFVVGMIGAIAGAALARSRPRVLKGQQLGVCV